MTPVPWWVQAFVVLSFAAVVAWLSVLAVVVGT
jgi:hypothetical protein